MNKTRFLLDQINHTMPPLQLAIALQQSAAAVGFDWSEVDGVLEKIKEELHELEIEIQQDSHKTHMLDELGDILFACCNLARHLGLDPEHALNASCQKFYRRFNYVESCVTAQQKSFADFALQELDNFWDQAKALEKHRY